jgi:acetoacetyl-CoA synthetase
MKRGDQPWRPTPEYLEGSQMASYLKQLEVDRGLTFSSYRGLHDWSTSHLADFWTSVWDYFGVKSYDPPTAVLSGAGMPGNAWFPGASLNYAEHILWRVGSEPAVIERNQDGRRRALTWDELRDEVSKVRAALVDDGVQPGDVVAVYSPPSIEALTVYLAAASIGATYTSCASELGVEAVLSRLSQVEPRILFAADGYRYGRKTIDRRSDIAAITAALPGLKTTVLVDNLYQSDGLPSHTVRWAGFVGLDGTELSFEPVPFEHPLVVVYSSGTTGAPKCIVHSHGGVLLEHFKSVGLQLDVRTSDRFFWYTTTSWMMWNYLVSGLLVGASIVLFDGDPTFPSPDALWRMAAEEGVSVFGVSPRFLQTTRRLCGRSIRDIDLSTFRIVGSTGSALGLDEYEWFYDVAEIGIPLVSASGGTDVLSGFVGWNPMTPIYAGEISCAALGVDIEILNPSGQPVVGEQGELVVRKPMPSMPLGLWGDTSGSRLRETYFEQNPGVWTQGDWAEETSYGSFVLSGRSDATLNRSGVRIGTAELYRVVENVAGVADSVAVCIEGSAGSDDLLLLFVVPGEDAVEEGQLEADIKGAVRQQLSPRHVPNLVLSIPEVPRNLAGKKMEIAIKAILRGQAPSDSREASAVPVETSAYLETVRKRL